MGNDKVVSRAAPAVVEDALTELLPTGARRLIEAAEFEECLSGFADERLPDGRRRVVRNGHLPRREIVTGIGAVEVEVPKLRSRSGSSAPFRSSLVPPYVRRSASLDAAVPWLYPHGVSTGRMRAAVSGAGGRGSGSRAVGERGDTSAWADEIHPNRDGFHKLTDHLVHAIEQAELQMNEEEDVCDYYDTG